MATHPFSSTLQGANQQPLPPQVAQEFVLLASGQSFDKGLNIARFYDSSETGVNLSNWQHPVFVVRESKDGKEVPFRRPSSDQQNLTLQQRQLLRKQALNNRRALTWRVEDAAKKNCFLGNVEGGAAGSYVLFKKEEGNVLRVIPIDDWFNFRRKSKIVPLSYEDAEARMKAATKDKKVPEKAKVKKEDDGADDPIKTEKFNVFGDPGPQLDDEEEIYGKRKIKPESFDFSAVFDDDADEDKSLLKEIERDEGDDAKSIKKLLRKQDKQGDSDSDSDSDELFPGAPKVKKEKEKEKGKDKEDEKRGTKRKATDGQAPAAKKLKVDVQAAIGITEKDFEDQIRGAILVRGKLSTKDLINKFKPIIKKSPEAKEVFTAIVKRIGISHKEDGQTYLVLKDDTYRNSTKR